MTTKNRSLEKWTQTKNKKQTFLEKSIAPGRKEQIFSKIVLVAASGDFEILLFYYFHDCKYNPAVQNYGSSQKCMKSDQYRRQVVRPKRSSRLVKLSSRWGQRVGSLGQKVGS